MDHELAEHLKQTMRYCLSCGDTLGEVYFCGLCGARLLDLPELDPELTDSLPEEYVVLEDLGEGSRGRVFKAMHRRMCRTVALRILQTETSVEPPPSRDRYYLDGCWHLAARLEAFDDPRIARVYEIGQVHGGVFLATQWVDGQTLDNSATPVKRDDIEDWVKRVRQIAAALGAAHASGICHWNLHPGNLIIAPNRDVVLLDLGVVQLAAHEEPPGSDQLGTSRALQFTAPEIRNGQTLGGFRSDIYSLGLILYKLAFGRLPEGTRSDEGHSDYLADYRGMENGDSDSEIIWPLQQLLRKMTAPAPESRPKTMKQVDDGLEKMLDAAKSRSKTVRQVDDELEKTLDAAKSRPKTAK